MCVYSYISRHNIYVGWHFVFSRLPHVQFGAAGRDRGDIDGREKHVFGEEATATPRHAIPAFRLSGVLGNRNQRTNVTPTP